MQKNLNRNLKGQNFIGSSILKNTKEIVIKRTLTPKIVFYVGPLLITAFAIKLISETRYITGVLFILFAILFPLLRKLEPSNIQLLIKISEQNLWTRNKGNTPWPSITCIKFRHTHNHVFMDIYRGNNVIPDEELNLHNANISIWRLKRILRRHVKVENH